MKLTITIYSNEDALNEMRDAIDKMCCYSGELVDHEFVWGEDDEDHKVEKCQRCGCEYFHNQLDDDGMCDDCANEIADGKEG